VFIVCLFALPRKGKDKKKWTQETGRTNRLTMDTRKGKDKQTNNEHNKREEQTDKQ
jgi:hypothetical protein